ncbi:hypothetical protein COY95_04195, partial [Candidatus Woesearchaeota archaeon CG_4_10_14_0_8_um_filter_47_5]
GPCQTTKKRKNGSRKTETNACFKNETNKQISTKVIDTTLIDKLKILADKEKKVKEYRERFRIKGKVKALGKTKKDNLTLTVEKDREEYKFTVLKSHKKRFALANRLQRGNSVSVEGIPKFRYIICTRLKVLEKGLAEGKQGKLENYFQVVSS